MKKKILKNALVAILGASMAMSAVGCGSSGEAAGGSTAATGSTSTEGGASAEGVVYKTALTEERISNP